MTEHTKLPWRVEQGTDLIWGACNPDDQSTYGMGYSIIEGRSGAWCRGKPEMDEREANAAFIVKAVNSHEAFAKALLQIEQISDNCVNAEVYTAEDALNHLQGIRNIIKGLRIDVSTGKQP